MSQAMIIEWVEIKSLKENPDNPRVISEEKFKKLCKSLEDFPSMLELRPIIVKDNIVIGGNMRLKACHVVGLKKVPIIRADDYSEEQVRQFIVKDNLSLGSWDMDLLGSLYDYQELESWGFDFPEMPEMETLEKSIDDGIEVKKKFEIIVELESEKDQENLYNELTHKGLKCRVLTL